MNFEKWELLAHPVYILTFKKRGLDRASKSGKFVKEYKSMIPVLGMNTVSCGKKLLRISEDFSETFHF